MIASDKVSDNSEKSDSFDHVSKELDDLQARELLSKLSKNFDSRHSKISIINRSRKFISDILREKSKEDKKLSVFNSPDCLKEFFIFTDENGCDFEIKIKTHKAFMFDFSIGYGNTIPQLNQAMEKTQAFIDLKRKLQLRSYFWDLIISSSDCVFDCNCFPDEFTFRLLDKPSKTTVEVFIYR